MSFRIFQWFGFLVLVLGTQFISDFSLARANSVSACEFELLLRRVMDISRTDAASMLTLTPGSAEDVIRGIEYARTQGLKISLKGTNHTHGGHNRLREDMDRGGNLRVRGIQLDMRGMRKLVSINTEGDPPTVTVQAGMTWRELAEILNPLGLAARTEQSSNIFSIGGAVATNVHGRDTYGPLIRSVRALKLVTADGVIQQVSREQNPKLFYAIFGSYGAFGVITEVTLQVQKNDLLQAKVTKAGSVQTYLEYLNGIENGPPGLMHYARVNLAQHPGQRAFEDIHWVEWTPVDSNLRPPEWKGWALDLKEKNRWVSAMLMNLMRVPWSSHWGLRMKEFLDGNFGLPRQGQIKTKNNVMNNPVQFLFDFFYNKNKSVDILQEYFFAPERLPEFLRVLETVVRDYRLNLMNLTLRYVPEISREEDGMLSPYSHQGPQLAAVLYFNVSEPRDYDHGPLVQYDGSQWTRRLIAEVQKMGGTFYWPYHRWWTREQLKHGQEEALKEFSRLKGEMDPDGLFMSDFLKEVLSAAGP